MNWIRIALWAACCAALLAGAAWLRAHFVSEGFEQGSAAVQSHWDEQKRVDLQASLDLERERSREQLLRFKNAERNTDEQTRLAAERLARDGRAAAQLQRLLATIATLNRRELPGPTDDAGVAALAREATTSRELLGRCAARYRSVAAGADELRDQVTGLQTDALTVCRIPPPAP